MTWLDDAAELVREAAPEHAEEILASLTEAIADVDLDDDAVDDAVSAALESWLDIEPEDTAEAFDPSAHPRAAAGAAGGGQFAAGGGGGAAASKAPPGKAASRRKAGETLSFDAKSNRGAGYGRKGGDPRVRKLQKALTKLGLTDAAGRKLVVDGKLGPKTTAAIKAAQKRLGVPADGKVTPALLVKLTAAKSLGAKSGAKSAKPAAKKAAQSARSGMGSAPKKAMGSAPSKRPASNPTGRAAPAASRARMGQSRAKEADMTDVQPEGTTESPDRIGGRVLEAKGVDDAGGRIFRVQIIEAGESKNRRSYPAAVLAKATRLYEGAKAYDHHRTPGELATSTIAGLVGSYRNVEASDVGLEGDLHLLPSATHTAEALDASLAAQGQGLPPLVGISHDAMTYTRPITVGGRRLQEAVSITKVNSADVVADPAAGGKATRVLAGGIEEETDPEGDEPDGQSTQEEDVPLTSETVLAALQTATPEQLAAVGLSKASETTEMPPEATATTEAVTGIDKASFLGGLMIERKVESAGLPATIAAQLATTMPDRITESDVDAQIAALKSIMGVAERGGLAPTVTAVVTQESLDKKKAALDGFFAGDYSGYRSFRQAYLDITGRRAAAWDENLNKQIMRESAGSYYDSGDRTTESMTTTSWDVILGDSITRRMVAMYDQPSLQNWRQVVSSVVPVNDFRTQRIDRLGGYGVLPAVNQGAPYQPLTSPTDEEVTYAMTKRGGTEDLTLEMVANDDVRAIGNIPKRLGLAAARTLHNFVWDFFSTNPTIYDSLALFHATHTNTTAVALAQSAVSTLRRLMRSQTGYGDTSNILSLTPKFLVVPNELEELAFQICTSAVAIPSTPAGPTDTPNIHQGLQHIVVDYFTDADDWFMVADPNQCPTIEIGFYQGRQEPELFTQSDQTQGSMFNSDKLTWKIRHIYSGAALEFRGLQRGTQ
jgi:peptidoglycan hydrolase-like protein with peptidoglycan-binding domain